MPESLQIHVNGALSREIPLTVDQTTIGKSMQCQARIEHDEIADSAAMVTRRGDSYVFENRCPFEVFLGQQKVPPGQIAYWPIGEWVTLSPSVSVSLVSSTLDPEKTLPQESTPSSSATSFSSGFADADEDTKKRNKQYIQIGVIVVCLLAAPLLLSIDLDEPPPRVTESYGKIREAVATSDVSEEAEVLRLLDHAYRAERQSPRQRQRAIKLYEQLLTLAPIKNAHYKTKENNSDDDETELYRRVRRFASEHRQRLLNGPTQ